MTHNTPADQILADAARDLAAALTAQGYRVDTGVLTTGIRAAATRPDPTAGLPDRFADAPRAASHNGLIHTCNGPNLSGLPFGRKDTGHCARCWEMVYADAAPRTPEWTARLGSTARREQANAESRRAHFAPDGPHARGKCGPVCTAFDW